MIRDNIERQLRDAGLNEKTIRNLLSTYDENKDILPESKTEVNEKENIIKIQHDVDTHVRSASTMVPTSINEIKSYKRGTIVELPPFAEGQPFIARMIRPSMLALVKTGKIPNSLLNQATSLFANGAGALNNNGKNATNVSDLFDVIDVIVDAALLEPTLSDIRSAGMELTDDQLMAIFSYTQRGVKALEQFRTE